MNSGPHPGWPVCHVPTLTVEPPRDVIIHEPTVGEIRNWLVELEKLKSNPIDFVT
ncbi:MAG: hypothetical protein HQL96_04995, partial [Magnetococcales bacterium]|nr:hypothetical protein [Magnetococcales bacterium]